MDPDNVVDRLAAMLGIRMTQPVTLTTENKHRSRIRILRIFSFLKVNEFNEFFSVEKNRKKFVILQIVDV